MGTEVHSMHPRPADAELAALVRRFGGSVSGAVFDPAVEVFRADGIDGVVEYRHGFGCAVSIGDPVCAKDDMPRLAEAFRQECRRRNWHTVYAVASEPFAAWAMKNGYAAVEFARELIVDPRRDVTAGPSARNLRGKIHHAKRDGVIVAEYRPAEDSNPELERAMEAVAEAWLAARHGPQVYLSQLSLFAGRAAKRWFYAKLGDKLVGVAQFLRLDAYDGYLLSQLLATPEAPGGTTELLCIAGLQTLGSEGCSFVTWGPAPASELGRVQGLGRFSERVGRVIFRAASRTFHLEQRNDFRQKFTVAKTTGSYLLFNPPKIGPREAIEVLSAFHALSPRAHN